MPNYCWIGVELQTLTWSPGILHKRGGSLVVSRGKCSIFLLGLLRHHLSRGVGALCYSVCEWKSQVLTPLSLCQHAWSRATDFSRVLGFYCFLSCWVVLFLLLGQRKQVLLWLFSLPPLAFPYCWLLQLQVWIYEVKRKLREPTTMFCLMSQSLLFVCLLLSTFQ